MVRVYEMPGGRITPGISMRGADIGKAASSVASDITSQRLGLEVSPRLESQSFLSRLVGGLSDLKAKASLAVRKWQLGTAFDGAIDDANRATNGLFSALLTEQSGCGTVGYVGEPDTTIMEADGKYQETLDFAEKAGLKKEALIGLPTHIALSIIGLQRTISRGFHGAGISCLYQLPDGTVHSRVWKLAKPQDEEGMAVMTKLAELVKRHPIPHGAAVTIVNGHTRAATHGNKEDVMNAHPHIGKKGEIISDGTHGLVIKDPDITVIHNGVIENYGAIRLKNRAHRGETDSEVLTHLIEKELETETDLMTAVQNVLNRDPSAASYWGLIVVSKKDPKTMIVARGGNNAPNMSLGIGEHEKVAGSEIAAITHFTSQIIPNLEIGEIARLSAGKSPEIRRTQSGELVRSKTIKSMVDDPKSFALDPEMPNYCWQEIHRGPTAIRKTLEMYTRINSETGLREINIDDIVASDDLARLESVEVHSIGTSYHAALAWVHYIEKYAGISVKAKPVSETNDTSRIFVQEDGKSAHIFISQSGETKAVRDANLDLFRKGFVPGKGSIDTIVSSREELESELGVVTVAVTNKPDSTLERETAVNLRTPAGRQIPVASYAPIMAQETLGKLFALKIARAKGMISAEELDQEIADLEKREQLIRNILESPVIAGQYSVVDGRVVKTREGILDKWAELLVRHRSAHIVSRGAMLDIVKEMALKMQEECRFHISAQDADAFRHGPGQIMFDGYPIMAVVPHREAGDALSEQVFGLADSNFTNLQSHGSAFLVIGYKDEEVERRVDHIVRRDNDRRILLPKASEDNMRLMYLSVGQMLSVILGTRRNQIAESIKHRLDGIQGIISRYDTVGQREQLTLKEVKQTITDLTTRLQALYDEGYLNNMVEPSKLMASKRGIIPRLRKALRARDISQSLINSLRSLEQDINDLVREFGNDVDQPSNLSQTITTD